MGARVVAAFRTLHNKRNHDQKRTIRADFEDGQWWITDLDGNIRWAVKDSTGPNTTDGFAFEIAPTTPKEPD